MKRIFLAASILLGCAVGAHAQETVASLTGSRAPTAILRMMPSDTPENQRFGELEYIAGFEVIGDAVTLDDANGAAISTAMKQPGAFSSGEEEKNMRPGVAYRFGSGDDSVDMLVCFSCDKVGIVPHGDQSIALMQDISQPMRDALLSVAKASLPDDEAIQELPRIRSENPVPPPSVPVPEAASE